MKFIEHVPKILESSGNLYSLLALMVLAIALVTWWFFRTEGAGRRERVLIYLMLFFAGVGIFVAGAAGFSSGVVVVKNNPTEIVSAGSENITQIETAPNMISLAPDTYQKIEAYLKSDGKQVTDDNKTTLLNEAVEQYVSKEAQITEKGETHSSLGEIENEESSASSLEELTDEKTVSDFKFQFQGCFRKNEVDVDCSFLVKNLARQDRRLTLYGYNSSRPTRLVDLSGVSYQAEEVAFGNYRNRVSVREKLVHDVEMKAIISFSGIENTVGKVRLFEISAHDNESQYYTIKLRNVAISS